MTNSELRARAKELLVGKYKNVIILVFIVGVIVGIFNSLSNSYAPTYNWETLTVVDPGNPGLQNLFSIIGSVLTMLFAVSLTRVFIKVVSDAPVVVEKDLLFGFTYKPVRTLIASFLQGLFIGLWTLLFIIPGLVKVYSYAMTQYLLVKTEVDASDTITLSKKLMKGHKMDLFLLDLSYLPEYILGIFTLGIYWLWTGSRHETARTLFFNQLYDASMAE